MDDEVPNELPPANEPVSDPRVTPELFLEWRAPRFGRANPERMNNPVWEWLIQSRLSAYAANQKFGGHSALRAGPGWCFDRFGQSTTELPDGRKVLIAGEHEDHYDPDFYIYNDVVFLHPDGKLDIFGYPAAIFPPTDFHTATLVANQIVLIGSLGYTEQRQSGTTPVLTLDLDTLQMTQVQTTGPSPGWLHKHDALLEQGGGSILVRHGKLDRGRERSTLVENIDDWRLNLSDWRWERLTDRQWPRFEIIRTDRRPNHLWQLQQAGWYRSFGWTGELEKLMMDLTEKLGSRPDLEAFGKLFCPSTPHEQIAGNPEEYNVTRIKVQGVLVRYVVDMSAIVMTVEGELPAAIANALAFELGEKFAVLENSPCEVKPLLD